MKPLALALFDNNFEPEAYLATFNESIFTKTFPLNNNSLEFCFNEVNEFLALNGFEQFAYDKFLDNELEISNNISSIYADPYCVDENKQLVCVLFVDALKNETIYRLRYELVKFRNERDWEQFHNPKDLALAINIEAGELLELFLWKSPEEANIEKIKEELADVLAYALLLADKYNLNVNDIVLDKINKNADKYPIEKAKGTAKKYNEI
jgi:NTP pyrophosphatase (non-canonical NTP hydrolase)